MTSRGRTFQVIDTNVLVAANHQSGFSRKCASRCGMALLAVKTSGAIVIDAGGHILSEYRKRCCLSGQPGLGDSFIKWVHDNLGRSELVQTVRLTPKNGEGDFVEFPEHEALAKFDPADKKFVAAANAHQQKPPILQAADSKWWGWRKSLAACGISIEFLCEDEIQSAFERKFHT